ncbi:MULTISPECIES: RNA ligase family protein [Flavobacterium]|uniref:RNA ligase family protein n=1 Tax=Flavobacterium jumunjinense TaxID=998845 RepID=A0ABV5GS10_9FLAO|nr:MULTISPECIES: RNA ligase family protein [Flavobacterium]
MEFRKYNSIENTYQKQVLEQIIMHGFEKETYIVQEKVHGANFSFYTDGVTIKIAKRTDFVDEEETFFNAHEVAKRYKENVLEAFKTVQSEFQETQFIVIFGELFGGNYNHKDVPVVKNAIKVQKGVDYCPENDFYAFDIKVNGTHYLTVDSANSVFEKTGFFYAKTLFEGTLEEAFRYPNEFNSLIPDWLGLPKMEMNICEGVIIKPNVPKYFGNGSRVILKNKNDKWAEVGRNNKPKKEHKEDYFSGEAQNIWEAIQNYITMNRLYNVLSKEGEFHPKMIGKLVGLFSQDVIADFKKDHPNALEVLEKEEQKRINKRVNNQVIGLIKEEFMTFKV